jgi:hypothetical protein
MIDQGYAVNAIYPATVTGVTHIDWTHGATFDVELTSGSGQIAAPNVEVEGRVTCG